MRTLKGNYKIGLNTESVIVNSLNSKDRNLKRKDYFILDRSELRGKVIESGVYREDEVKKIESEGCKLAVCNSLNSSPFSNFSYLLSLEYAKKIVKGLKILMNAVASDSGEVVVPADNKNIIGVFEKEVFKSPNIFLKKIKDGYPAGFTRLLYKKIYSSSSKEKYFPGINGILIASVEKLLKIYLHVEEPENSGLNPVGIVKENKNFLIWTEPATYAEILEKAGIKRTKKMYIISGDPLYGKMVVNPDKEIMKTSGVVYLSGNYSVKLGKCIGCGKCIMSCAAGLKKPHSMVVLKEGRGMIPFEFLEGCIKCGTCGFLCPGMGSE